MSVRTRFAPSPTGYLHIGGVRTALFNWLYAKQLGGQFLLRIDDTDAQRNVQEALQPILEGFRWLGITWDEGPEVGGPYGPYFQSQRLDRYQTAAKTLLEKGLAYRDFATPDELKAERETAEREKRAFLYSRKWMAETDSDAKQFEAEGRQGVVRLKMPREGFCRFEDQVRGMCEFEWAKEQDHVIQRADGTCLYHLASVVDDDDFKITHVIRAIEHLSNTPRQIFIAEGLGYKLPVYAHLPYVAEPGSQTKLSKRNIDKYLKNTEFKRLYDHGEAIAKATNKTVSAATFNPVIVDFYREVGYLPEAILNYLLLLGWSFDDKKEDFTTEEMIKLFSLERVTKAPASFDCKKLWAFQDRRMQQVPVKSKVAKVLPYLQEAGLVSSPPPCDVGAKLLRILEAIGDRLKTYGDILAYGGYFFAADDKLVYEEKEFAKRLGTPESKKILSNFADKLSALASFDVKSLEDCLKGYVTEAGIKIGDIVHGLRLATTGQPVGPGVYDCLEILGKDAVINRINIALHRSANA